VTPDDFRELALGLEGAIERSHMNHPDFRVNGRIFATLHGDDIWGTVMITPEEQQALIQMHRQSFVPSAGAWGRQGCTNVRLATADESAVRGALIMAWERALAKPARPTSTRRAAPRKKTSSRRI
jgi:YjbR